MRHPLQLVGELERLGARDVLLQHPADRVLPALGRPVQQQNFHRPSPNDSTSIPCVARLSRSHGSKSRVETNNPTANWSPWCTSLAETIPTSLPSRPRTGPPDIPGTTTADTVSPRIRPRATIFHRRKGKPLTTATSPGSGPWPRTWSGSTNPS